MKQLKWWLMPVAAVALSTVVPTASAQDEGGAVMVSQAGVKAGIDRQTGKLRQLTAEESAQLDKDMARQKIANAQAYSGWRMLSPPDEATALAQKRVLPSGAVAMKLPETNLSSLHAAYDSDGNLVLSHSDEVPHAGPHAAAPKEAVQ